MAHNIGREIGSDSISSYGVILCLVKPGLLPSLLIYTTLIWPSIQPVSGCWFVGKLSAVCVCIQ